jgi:hypothetical protein
MRLCFLQTSEQTSAMYSVKLERSQWHKLFVSERYQVYCYRTAKYPVYNLTMIKYFKCKMFNCIRSCVCYSTVAGKLNCDKDDRLCEHGNKFSVFIHRE